MCIGRGEGRVQNKFVDYLYAHNVPRVLDELVNEVLFDMPADPYPALAKLLAEKAKEYDAELAAGGDVKVAAKVEAKSSGTKKSAKSGPAKHKLDSASDFPTLGA